MGKKIRRTYVVTQDVDRMLEELAEAARRDKSAQLCVIVERAYKEKEEKQTKPLE